MGMWKVSLLVIAFTLGVMPTAKAQDLSWMMDDATYEDGPTGDSLEEAVDYIHGLFYQAADGLHDRFDAKGANCNAFIQPNGTYGPHGRVIANGFKENPHLRNLLNDHAATARGIPTLCPRFAQLNQEERVKFWVWTFAAIAWDESTCKPSARAQGYTTTAIGLLQMEMPKKNRAWRGGLCKAPSVSGPRENLLCGMEIMSAHFDGDYSGKNCKGENARGLILNCSYWQKLRSISSPVANLIRLYPACSRSVARK
jgi:hypothetical protein